MRNRKQNASDRRLAVTLKNFETLLNKHGWKALEPYEHENLKAPTYFKNRQICDRCPKVKRDRSRLFSKASLVDISILDTSNSKKPPN